MVRVSGLGYFAVACWLALVGGGCALAPPGPRGPLKPTPGIDLAVDFSAAFSRAEAKPVDGFETSGTSDSYFTPATILPRRIEGRVAVTEWLDLGVDVGWVDVGGDVRVGRAARPGRTWAFALAGGARTSTGVIFESDPPLQQSLFGRLELYPLLHGALRTGHDSEGRLVLAAGLHAGTFPHSLTYRAYRAGEGPGGPSVVMVRRELRLETALGYTLKADRGSLLTAIEPYFVLDSGPPESCNCTHFEQSAVGVVFVLRAAVFFPFASPSAP